MPDVTVDTLKIQVEYDLGSKNIAKDINKISSALNKLSLSNSNLNLTKTINALTKLSQIKLTKVSKSLLDIKSALQQVISIPKEELLKFDERDVKKMENATIGGGKNVASILNQTYPQPLLLPENSSYEQMQNALQQATIKAQELAEKTKQINMNYLKKSIEQLQPNLLVLSAKINALQEKLKTNFNNIPMQQRNTMKDMLIGYINQYDSLTTKLQGIDVESANWKESLINVKGELASLTQNVNKTTTAVNAYKGSMKQTKETTENVEKATHKTTGKLGRLFASLKRIAFYRAIRRALQLIAQALQEGIQNVAIYDKAFNESMSQLKSSLLYLKNSLGTLIAPLIEMITPVITKFVDWVSVGIGKLAEVFAAMNGQETFTRAKKTVEDYAKSLDKAKKATVGFDEINIFGENETPISEMFETVEVGEEAKSFASTLNRIKNTLTQIGNSVVRIVKEVLPVILDIVNLIVEVLAPVVEALEPVIQAILELVKALIPIIQTIWDIVKPIVVLVADSLTEAIKGITPIVQFISDALGIIKPDTNTIHSTLGGINTDVINIKNGISGISLGNLITGTSLIHSNLFSIKDIVDAIKSAFVAIDGLLDKIDNKISVLGLGVKSPILEQGLSGFKDSVITGFSTNVNDYLPNTSQSRADQLMAQYGTPKSNTNMENNIDTSTSQILEEKSGDLIIQILDPSGSVKSENIIEEFLRKNRRDGKTVIPVFVN